MKKLLVLMMCSVLLSGCGGDDVAVAPTGNSTITGTVESFDGDAIVVSKLAGAMPGVVVTITGPVTRSATTDENGNFTFTNLPAGEYTLSFKYNDEEVSYRGNSGQEAKITLEESQQVTLTEVKVSGGQANVGSIKVSQLDEEGAVVEDEEEPEPDPEPEPEPEEKKEPEKEESAAPQGLAVDTYNFGPECIFAITWDAVEGAKSYEVVLQQWSCTWIQYDSDSPEGYCDYSWKTFLRKTVTDTTIPEYRSALQAAGRCRVRSFDANGQASEWSTWLATECL